MAKFEIPITQPTRDCIVGGRPGYFHLWEQYSEPIPASPLDPLGLKLGSLSVG